MKTIYYQFIINDFYPIALKGCVVMVFTHGVRMGRQWEEACLGCISETGRCKMSILGRDIGWGCRCAMSWCVFDLTFDLVIMTLTFKSCQVIYLRKPQSVGS